MVRDVVCGMGVEEDSPETFSMKYHGTRYFFCSADCLLLFSKAPHDYTNNRGEPKMSAKGRCVRNGSRHK